MLTAVRHCTSNLMSMNVSFSLSICLVCEISLDDSKFWNRFTTSNVFIFQYENAIFMHHKKKTWKTKIKWTSWTRHDRRKKTKNELKLLNIINYLHPNELDIFKNNEDAMKSKRRLQRTKSERKKIVRPQHQPNWKKKSWNGMAFSWMENLFFVFFFWFILNPLELKSNVAKIR